MGRASREKGARAERALVAAHEAIGVAASRVPLSGQGHWRGVGADLDVYAFGKDAAPLVCEVKARKSGAGFTLLERWLQDADVLFLRRDRAEHLVVMPWSVWTKLLARR